jgi:hypothetical protein
MLWKFIVIGLIVFTCAFFLVRWIYTNKAEKSEQTSQELDGNSEGSAESDEGQ